MPSDVAGGAFVTTLTRRDIEEVYTLRVALEQLAMRRAAERITGEQVESLDRILETMKAIPAGSPVSAAVELDLVFHDRIFEIADHGRLLRSWQSWPLSFAFW